jgi:hypothetical protein
VLYQAGSVRSISGASVIVNGAVVILRGRGNGRANGRRDVISRYRSGANAQVLFFFRACRGGGREGCVPPGDPPIHYREGRFQCLR